MAKRAGMSLEDVANKVVVAGHKGPHPEEYHEAIFDRLTAETRGLNDGKYAAAFKIELEAIKKEVSKAGTALNKLITKRK